MAARDMPDAAGAGQSPPRAGPGRRARTAAPARRGRLTARLPDGPVVGAAAAGVAGRRAAPGGLEPEEPAVEGCDTEGAGRAARRGAGGVPGHGARAPTTRAASAPALAALMSGCRLNLPWCTPADEASAWDTAGS
ncbi:hypothetical protein Stube_67840 [Streptomyces tubercidicus]|uniref:Uncharacterized protein n=1 Tax=Streptomyces tubercidicus TaxID=47759 RepID=A0A640V538_9ACTN|nr:hypothetical protein Stube_67840 [Streptomyces tubercidicus]